MFVTRILWACRKLTLFTYIDKVSLVISTVEQGCILQVAIDNICGN